LEIITNIQLGGKEWNYNDFISKRKPYVFSPPEIKTLEEWFKDKLNDGNTYNLD
jgi:hypothetical protein